MAENLLFTIGAKDTSAQVINKVKQNLKFLDQEYKNAQKGTKDFENTQEGLKAKLDMLSNKFEQTKIKLDAYNKKLEETKQKAADQAKKIEELKASFNMEEVISKSENKLKTYQEKIDKTTQSMEKEKNKLEELKKAEGDNSEAISKSEEKISNYQKKIDKLNGNLDKEKTHLENLKAGHADNDEAIAKAEAQLNKYNQQIEKTQQDIRLTEQELKNFSNESVNASNKLQNFKVENVSQKLKDLGDKTKTVGGSMSDAGDKILQLSAPIVAVGAATVKAGADFETSMSDVTATAKLTSEEAQKLSDKAKELGRDIKGASAKDVADSYKYLALAGQDANTMLTTIEPNVKASIAWNTDMASSTDMVTDSMSALGISTEKTNWYLDVLTKAQNSSNTTAMQLGEAYIACGNTLRSMGVPLEESATILGGMANQGIKASEAGNGLNSVLINLMGTTDTTSGALAKLGVKAYDDKGNFRGLRTVLEDCRKSMGNMTNEQKDMIAAALGGKTRLTEFQAMLNVTGDTYDDLNGKIKASDGALEEMYKTMTDNTKGSWLELKSMIESVGLEMADDLLPICKDVLEVAKSFVKWFGNLDEGTRKLIIETGLLTTATGGLLKAAGSVTSTIGSTVKGIGNLIGMVPGISNFFGGFSKGASATSSALAVMQAAQTGASSGAALLSGSLATMGPVLGLVAAGVVSVGAAMYTAHEYEKLMNGSVLDSTDNMNAFQKVLADLTGIQRYSNDELKEMGLKYEDFSDNIAPETKETMEGIAGKFRDVQTEIEKVNVSGMITDEEKQDVVNKVDDLCNTILGRVSGLQSESYQKMKATFELDGIIDESEQKILDSLDTGGKEITQKVSDIHNQINELNQNGALNTVEGREELQRKLSELQDIYAEEEKAKLEANQQDIDAFRDQANSLDLEKAQELLQEKAKIRDEEIQKTKENYDETLALLKSHVESCSEEERPLYEAKIEELENKRATELSIEESKYNDWFNMIETKYPEIAAQINKYNGEELTEYDKKKQLILEKMQQQYEGLDKITEDGTYTLYNKVSGRWNDVAVSVDKSNGKITAAYDTTTKACGGYSEELCESLKKVRGEAQNTSGNYDSFMKQMSGSTLTAKGEIINADNEVVGSVEKVGKAADGTREGIIKLNGTQMVIKCNKDNAITGIESVLRARNQIKDKTFTITTVFKTIGEKVKGIFGYATGTNSAQAGIATVAEEGPELVYNKNRSKSALVMSPSLVRLEGGEKILNAQDTMKALSGKNINGGFYNSNSLQSKNLINNTTTNTVTNNTTNNNMDLKGLGDVLTASFIKAINSFNGSSNKLTLDDIAFNTGNNFAKTKRRLRY